MGRSSGSIAPWVSVSAITLLAAGLRLYHIDAEPLWRDEAFSVWMARHSLPQLWDWLVWIDTHPPLYYTLLHFWLALGDSESVLRLLSALLGMLTIPLIYGLGRTVGGHRLGALAALLLAIAPYQVRFGQETRMYTLLTLAATLAMWGLAWLVRWSRAAARPLGAGCLAWWRAKRTGQASDRTMLAADAAWLAYVVGTAMVLLSHNAAMFLLVAANLIALGRWVDGNWERGVLRNWLLAQIAVLALLSAWLPSFVLQALNVQQNFRMPAPDLTGVAGSFHALYVSFVGRHHLLRLSLDLIVLTLVGLGLWASGPLSRSTLWSPRGLCNCVGVQYTGWS